MGHVHVIWLYYVTGDRQIGYSVIAIVKLGWFQKVTIRGGNKRIKLILGCQGSQPSANMAVTTLYQDSITVSTKKIPLPVEKESQSATCIFTSPTPGHHESRFSTCSDRPCFLDNLQIATN